MRYAILADIHGNLVAFTAVLQDIERRGGFDRIWCLGDIVGYGPEPHACIELLQQYDHICVAGNHDWAAIGMIDILDFNEDAALANQWTSQQLTEKDKEYLKSLPQVISEYDFSLAHGSPREPLWEYLFSTRAAEENLELFTTRFCLVGHSHIPLIFEQLPEEVKLTKLDADAIISLKENRLIINPGSVGQPRDHDPRASYVIYDSDTGILYHHRVEYDIEATQEKMLQEKLPEFLILRLNHGM
jgi:diadenosine tetraphosphatase ApaH/serine/threonine PP2A family protein phosphatase